MILEVRDLNFGWRRLVNGISSLQGWFPGAMLYDLSKRDVQHWPLMFDNQPTSEWSRMKVQTPIEQKDRNL